MYILKITLIFIFTISCNNLNINSTIYGTWEGNYNNHQFLIIFNNDQTCMLEYLDINSNKIETVTGKYELDFSKTPIPLSIRNISKINYPLHTIIKIINKDSIMMAEFSTKSKLRPITFQTEKIIFLSRIK